MSFIFAKVGSTDTRETNFMIFVLAYLLFLFAKHPPPPPPAEASGNCPPFEYFFPFWCLDFKLERQRSGEEKS